ncbi:unnamed protein product [Protopolystoma xenopodis]|uniref:Uncharacterized protein n=1 Tax=Protopolystoma xenopodis TaxID=117903 RepID=A0A3S5CUW4_9PLAT|nr:unnamed protein product [Protopolystoma xenopodis]
MAKLTDDAGETSGNVPHPQSDFGKDYAYNGLWTRHLIPLQHIAPSDNKPSTPETLVCMISTTILCQPDSSPKSQKFGSYNSGKLGLSSANANTDFNFPSGSLFADAHVLLLSADHFLDLASNLTPGTVKNKLDRTSPACRLSYSSPRKDIVG